jgi:hypothetical protein
MRQLVYFYIPIRVAVALGWPTKVPGGIVAMALGDRVAPGGGVGVHCGTLQQAGSLGSCTYTHPLGTLKNSGHLFIYVIRMSKMFIKIY